MSRPVAGRSQPLPQWVRPQLTQVVAAAPDGPQWVHEIEFDGYRMHAHLDRGAALADSRRGSGLDA
jgi:bifunctional non-homologous end joining protein LigD